MNNSSEASSFILGAYGDIGRLKYLYFVIILTWFLGICVSNLFLIGVIVTDRRLHEPMYLLMCNLFMSEVSGSTAVYPLLLSQMLSDTHEISLPACFVQIFHLYTSASVEYGTFAVMAFDRYVSICIPLYYSVIITNNRAAVVIVLLWCYSLVACVFLFFLLLRLTFCGNIIDKVFCDQHLVIKLACSASTIVKVSDLLFAVVTMAFPFTLISVSYLKILAVCLKTTKENKQKAMATCVPQLVSLSNMFIGTAFHFVDSRFGKTQVPSKVRVLLSVYLLVCQPVITPYLYGFKFPRIKQSCGRLLLKIRHPSE